MHFKLNIKQSATMSTLSEVGIGVMPLEKLRESSLQKRFFVNCVFTFFLIFDSFFLVLGF